MREEHRLLLAEKYKNKIVANPHLNRQLVSFQANKHLPFFRWFKFKEGFSSPLVKYLIDQGPHHRRDVLLDPFAGSGAALFSAKEKGLNVIGIELLPVGVYVIKNRLVSGRIDVAQFSSIVKEIRAVDFLQYEKEGPAKFNHLNITVGAFPGETEKSINGFLNYCEKRIDDRDIKNLLLFAVFSNLESISFTRKDGQYLRWDDRAHKNGGKTGFNKGKVYFFKEALNKKLAEMVFDISVMSRDNDVERGNFTLHEDSVLFKLPELEKESVDLIVTSPPYCNRYDYTRTYALELAFLGVDDEKLKELRQSLLTSTVENREKMNQLRDFYRKKRRGEGFDKMEAAFGSQAALKEIVSVLEDYKTQKKLNNPNILRMVKNYFFEMCLVIFEMYRVLKKDGIVYMVNDNVRYAGETIPVDLILSDFAESAGFGVNQIWKLNNGKGNSSQQMGSHGREELRKCIYVWQK